jgi:nitroreductase
VETLEAIAGRRSVRRFKDTPVSDEQIREILHAATLAPSGKNRQPWRFVVVRGERRAGMMAAMRTGLQTLKANGTDLGSGPATARVMAQAPVTIFVFNDAVVLEEAVKPMTPVDIILSSVDVQSIGAAIQNLLLAAHDQGLATLWMCDVFYAYRELCAFLGETRQMVAAIAVGYPAEAPAARPRKAVDEVTRWV